MSEWVSVRERKREREIEGKKKERGKCRIGVF